LVINKNYTEMHGQRNIKRPRGRPRNRWQDEMREDGRLVGVKGWKKMEYNREEWKKLLRKARNCRTLHMPVECMK